MRKKKNRWKNKNRVKKKRKEKKKEEKKKKKKKKKTQCSELFQIVLAFPVAHLYQKDKREQPAELQKSMFSVSCNRNSHRFLTTLPAIFYLTSIIYSRRVRLKERLVM